MTRGDAGSAERVTESRDEAEARGRRFLPAHEASWALWAVLRSADEAEHAIARALGLPYTDTLALNHILNATEPLGPVELGRRLGITSASATVLVDRLVVSGHVSRRPDPGDGRRRILEATEQARVDIVNAMAPLLHALDAVAARLDGDAAAVVISYLRDVTEVHRDHSTSSRRRPH